MKNKRVLIPVFFALSVIVIFVFLMISYFKAFKNTEVPTIDKDSVNLVNDWEYEKFDGKTGEFDIPFSINVKLGKNIIVKKTLPIINDGDYLYFNTNYQSVVVKIDGTEYEVYGINEDKLLKFKCQSPWVKVQLDSSCSNKEIEIIITSSGSKFNVEIYNAYVGNEESIRLNLSTKSRDIIYITSFLKITGVVFVLLSLCLLIIKSKTNALRFFYLAMYFYFTCVWIYSDSILHYLDNFGKSSGLMLNIFSFTLMPIPMILYTDLLTVPGSKNSLLKGAAIALIIFNICVLFSILVGVFELSISLLCAHILYAYSIIVLCITMLNILLKNKDNAVVIVSTLSFGLIVFSSIAAFISFYFGIDGDNTSIFKYCSVIYGVAISSIGIFDGFVNSVNKKAMEELQLKEEEYRIACAQTGKYILKYDIKKDILSLQDDAASLFKLPTSLLDFSRKIDDYIYPENADFVKFFIERLQIGEKQGYSIKQLRIEDKTYWFRIDFTTLFDTDNIPTHAILTMSDNTESHEKELAYEKWHQLFKDLPEKSMNYYEYNLTNDLFEKMSGSLLYGSFPKGLNRTLRSMLEFFCDKYGKTEERTEIEDFLNRDRLYSLIEHEQYSDEMECHYKTNKGDYQWIRISIQLISDPYTDDEKCFILIKNINDEKLEQENINYLVSQDYLTGLLNRKAFIDKVNEIINSSIYEELAIILIDINGFKGFNDTYGHQFGDRVLIDFSNKLATLISEDDILCRLGGDEFVICVRNINAIQVSIEEYLRNLNEQSVIKYGHDVVVSCSMGLALYPLHGKSFDDLYHDADLALYHCKNSEEVNYCVYDETLKNNIVNIEFNNISPINYNEINISEKNNIIIFDKTSLYKDLLSDTFKDDYGLIFVESTLDFIMTLRSNGNNIAMVIIKIDDSKSDGMYLTKIMSEDSYLSTFDVIAISNDFDQEILSKTIEYGVDSTFKIPFETALLKLRVNKIIQKNKQEIRREHNRIMLDNRTKQVRKRK